MSYKPAGFTSLAPYALVANVEATLGFIDAVFGEKPVEVLRGVDGDIRHAAVKIDDTVLMLGGLPPGQPINLHLYVKDVDAVYQRALSAGAHSVEAPTVQEYGDRRGAITDPHGITWWIATRSKGANEAR